MLQNKFVSLQIKSKETMNKKRYIKSFSNFDGEAIECEISSIKEGTEFTMHFDNTKVTLQFASTIDLVNWCNNIKELAIEKINDEG